MRRTGETRRFAGIVDAVHGADAPSQSVVRKSISRLQRTMMEEEKNRRSFRQEHQKITKEIYAPLGKMLKQDAKSERAARALKRLPRRRFSLPRLPKVPAFAPAIGTGSLCTVAAAPYAMHWAFGDRAAVGLADPYGSMNGAVASNGGGGWVWCGVGFHFRPLFDVTLAIIRPLMSYSFLGWGICSWTSSAHSQGNLGVHVHEYGLDWQDRDPQNPVMHSMPLNLWNHTTATSHVDRGSGFNSNAVSTLLFGGSNYLIWATVEASCYEEDGWFGSADAYAEVKAQCMAIEVCQMIFPLPFGFSAQR